MTITPNDTRDEYTATASQTVFSYTFKIFEDTDLNVYQTLSGATANDTTDIITAYTVTGAGDEDGGTITLTTGASAGDLITIASGIPESRTVDYQPNGDFLPATVNDDNDRVVSLAKQTSDRANRTLAFQESQQGVSGLDLPLPSAQKFLRWRQDLSGMENVEIDSSTSLVQVSYALSDYADLAAAIADIGLTVAELWINQNDSSNATVPENITLRFIPGNVISGVVEIYSPANISASSQQLIFSGSGITFTNGGTVYPDYWTQNTVPGTTDMSNALVYAHDSMGSNNGVIKFNPLNYLRASGGTISNNITLHFKNGGIIDLVIGGNTLFIQGGVIAGPKQQIFDITTGTITGGQTSVDAIYPHWFGIDGTADQVEIMYAINWAQAASVKCLIPWSPVSSLSTETRYDIADSVYIPTGRNYVTMADVGPSEFASTGRPGLFEWSGGNTTPNAIIKVGRQNQSYIAGICASASASGATALGEDIAGWLFYNPDENGSNYGHNLFEKISSKSCDFGFLLGNAGTLAIPDDSNGNWYGPNSGYATPDTQTNFNHCIWRNILQFDCANGIVYDADNSDNSWLDGYVGSGTGQRTAARAHEIRIKLCGNQMQIDKVMTTGFRIPDDNAVILIEDGDGSINGVNLESGEADATTALGDATTRWDVTNTAGSTYRYTYNSTGTDPGVTTLIPGVGIEVTISTGGTFAAGNQGTFTTTASNTDYFEVTNASGVVESGKGADSLVYATPIYRRVLDLDNTSAGRGEWSFNDFRFVNFRDSNGRAIETNYRAGVNFNGIATSGHIYYNGQVTASGVVYESGYDWEQGLSGSATLQHIGTWEKSGGAGTNISGDPKGDLTIDTLQTTDFSLRAYGHMFNKHNTSVFLTDNTAIDICTWTFDADQGGSVVFDLTYSIGNMSATTTQALEGGRILMTAVQDTGNNITTNITESESTQVLDGYSSLTTTWAVDSATANTVTITLNQNNDLNTSFRGSFFTIIMATDQSESDSDKTKFNWDF